MRLESLWLIEARYKAPYSGGTKGLTVAVTAPTLLEAAQKAEAACRAARPTALTVEVQAITRQNNAAVD